MAIQDGGAGCQGVTRLNAAAKPPERSALTTMITLARPPARDLSVPGRYAKESADYLAALAGLRKAVDQAGAHRAGLGAGGWPCGPLSRSARRVTVTSLLTPPAVSPGQQRSAGHRQGESRR